MQHFLHSYTDVPSLLLAKVHDNFLLISVLIFCF